MLQNLSCTPFYSQWHTLSQSSTAFILRGNSFSAVSNLEGLPVEEPAELLVARPGDQVETDGCNSQPAIIQESAWCLSGLQVDVVDAEISRERHAVFGSLLSIFGCVWKCLKTTQKLRKTTSNDAWYLTVASCLFINICVCPSPWHKWGENFTGVTQNLSKVSEWFPSKRSEREADTENKIKES